jgi:hypothetical protein
MFSTLFYFEKRKENIIMCPETKQKIKEIRSIVEYVRKHPAYTPELNIFLENIIFFLLDFEYEEFDHVQEWLTMYDIQAHQKSTFFQIYPPINPDYLLLENNPFEDEFQKIKEFFEFVRAETKKVGG